MADFKQGQKVRVTFDAVYLAEPDVRGHEPAALVVLPGTDIDITGIVLLLDRFRVPRSAVVAVDDAREQVAAELERFADQLRLPTTMAQPGVPDRAGRAALATLDVVRDELRERAAELRGQQ